MPKLKTIITAMTAIGCAYYLLLTDNFFNCSISAIIDIIHDIEIAPHAFIVGLLPIYIALTIFSSLLFGLFTGNLLNRLANKLSIMTFLSRLKSNRARSSSCS